MSDLGERSRGEVSRRLHPRIKICGVMRPVDAAHAISAGAEWIGINFHPASPRSIVPEVAAGIVAAIPSDRAIGVFVDRDPAEVIAIARFVGLSIVQLHGNEPPEHVFQIKSAGIRVVRAFRIADASGVVDIASFQMKARGLGAAADAVLVDAFVPGLAGGTGKTIPSEILGLLPPSADPESDLGDDRDLRPRLILAGGLNPGNVSRYIDRVRPWMVDVAGGVESAPGIKDPELVDSFIRSVKSEHRNDPF